MTVLNDSSRKIIKEWNQTLESSVQIKLILPEAPSGLRQNDSPINQFKAIADELNGLASNLTITPTKKETRWPGFELTPNLFFSAFPLEKELKPFLKALSEISDAHTPQAAIMDHPEKINIPANLKLYIALFCPHCPIMVETLVPMALHYSKLNLHIIDGTLFEQAAKEDAVKSAPCLILDDTFRWTGSVTEDEIIGMITDRSISQLSMESLKNIMEDGNAEWITREMIKEKKISNAFVQLLCHTTWSVRLGAIVVVEELTEKAPELALSLCPLIITEFDSKDVTTQGDLLYAMGEAGDNSIRQWITDRSGSFFHPDLIDAAKEAVDAISERHGPE